MKGILKIGVIIMLLALAYGIYYAWGSLPIMTAYSAKNLCSCTFIANRSPNDILEQDLSDYGIIDADVDLEKKEATVSVFGLAKRTAIFRERVGCTLLNDVDGPTLRGQFDPADIAVIDRAAKDSIFIGLQSNLRSLDQKIKQEKLKFALDNAFTETKPDGVKGTRAVVVLYNGKVIAERYAENFSKDTPLIGWSMAKSVTNALVGILANQGKLSLTDKALFREWQGENDPRREITLDMLMRMSSGLAFVERYDIPSDATRMLFNSYEAANIPLNKKLAHPVDSFWSYSTGTTNIISKYVKNKIVGSLENYFSFPQTYLFNKIGVQSAVIEPDPSGTFVGSSFMFATARDWARLGQLYLQDGVWNGERILPEGWVTYSSTMTPTNKDGNYGAQFWMDKGDHNGDKLWPNLPRDLYRMSGFQGQSVTIIPSEKLVIVRLGQSKNGGFDYGEFIGEVLGAVNQQ